MKHRMIILLLALLALLIAACAPASIPAAAPAPTQPPAKVTPDMEKVIKPQPDDWKRGPDTAKVKIIEWGDFQ